MITLRGFLVGFFLTVRLVAAPAPIPPGNYMPVDAVEGRALLPAPPEADSIVARAERETMRNLQGLRTPPLVALAKRYDNINVFVVLRPVLGEWCTPASLPKTSEIFERARADVEPCIERTKANWNRPRPYAADPMIVPVVYRPANTSYPSGHSVLGEVFAVLLTTALPERTAEWARQSEQIRWSRIVGGVHFPSDTVAGGTLGHALALKLLESPKLKADLEIVREEVKAAERAHAAPATESSAVVAPR